MDVTGKVVGARGGIELAKYLIDNKAHLTAPKHLDTNSCARLISYGVLRGLVVHCYALWCKVPQRTPHKLLKNKEI